MSIRSLVENKSTLDYKALTLSLIQEIGINETVNWDAVIPAAVQHNLFGGEILRLFSDHESFANQKDIRTIALKKGETSQLLILFAQLKDEKLSKANIERITKKFIGGQAAERFVVWFLGNPDNTQFKVVLSGKEGKKIVLKTLPFGVDQPYYKTYDFILDEVHKKVSGFFVEPNELWKALWKSFDISVVNKRFYEDIKKSFDLLVNNNILSGAIRNVEARKQFVVRLIGRIIFCWFLKKKTIIDEAVLCSSAVNKYEDYYGQFLEKLFFDVFNTPQKERRKDLPEEIKNYPFLNGGLFEDQKGNFGDYKGYINIATEWFEDIFKHTLEKYNFTIDENTSANSEIAIDPEMLGRIFENLLAEQNPDTQESARKSTGSYYTPREIVDYMVEQSLIEYIKSNLNKGVILNEAKWSEESYNQSIEDFVHTEELSDEIKPFTNDILEKLNSVKVLDPACGSGAFPIGMLQKLIALKLQLSPLSKGGNTKGVYELKLSTILNSIYGCDIQPMAVELSRLRCWLSLIIDEPVDKKKTNWGIENLPNLDFKFVCVNTLISLPKMTEDSLGTSADDFEKLKELRTEFFTASAKRKIKIEDEFKQLQEKIAEKHREWSTKNTEAVLMLTNWNPFRVDETDWFEPFWMFGIIDGFDIVIGNPPYVRADSPSFASFRKQIMESNEYVTLYERWDLMVPFYEKSLKLLNDNGVNAFIASNSITTSKFAYKLQDWIIVNYKVCSINYFEDDMQIFEAGVVPVVTLIQKTKNKVIPKKIYRSNTFSNISQSIEVDMTVSNNLRERIFKKSFSSLYYPADNSNLLGDICYVSYGLRPNSDERYWQGEFTKDDLISDFKDKVHCKSYVEGKYVKEYIIEKIKYLEWDTDRSPKKLVRPTFPALYEGEKIFRGRVTGGTFDDTGILCNDSIVVFRRFVDLQNVNERSIAVSISKNNFVGKGSKTSSQVAKRRKELEKISENYSLKYLLAVINSKYALAYLNNFRKHRLVNYFYPDDFRNYPVPQISLQDQQLFVNLVDKILSAKKQNPHTVTKGLEDQIDIMVYKLYNLTYEEIKIIDSNIEQLISKEAYEKFPLS